jgi:hypothetical protein
MAFRSWKVSIHEKTLDGETDEIVEPIHQPEDRHDPPVELSHKGDLTGVSLLMCA